uniref:Prostaglandin D2 receptor n=1 Tax=Chelonoidis abingdonii TaxID=106734 RepID=A0A8C0H5Q6_CHEAB
MELDHLVLLALMTVLFTVCSLPLIVTFAADFNEKADLTALRFLSVNSIVDPWVFIIFRTSVFRKFFHRVCRRLNSKKAVTVDMATSTFSCSVCIYISFLYVPFDASEEEGCSPRKLMLK